MGKATRKTDPLDEQKRSSWIKSFNPLTDSESLNGSLRALSSGIIAYESTSIDCGKAESVGQEIQEKLTKWSRPRLNKK